MEIIVTTQSSLSNKTEKCAQSEKAKLNLSRGIFCHFTVSVLSAGVRTWTITQIPNNSVFFFLKRSSQAEREGERARGMKKLRRDACVSLQSRCLACLMLRSYVMCRISSVLSARPLGDEGWRGLAATVGNTCWRLTGSFISKSPSLTRIRPSLCAGRAVM